MGLFRQVYAVDVNGLPIASEMKGRIYAVDDTNLATPLVVTSAANVPISFVLISAAGVNQSFSVADKSQVLWVSEDGERRVIFESLSSMLEASETAALTAATVLAQAQNFLGTRGVPGGIAALNAEGNVMDADEEVVGNETRRAGSVIFASGATTARPTASTKVMVIWITEGADRAPVNAVPGIDVWLNQIGGQ